MTLNGNATEITANELVGLAKAHLPGALLGFDVDGVLAPLVAHAEQARLASGVDAALGVLAHRFHVALVSGRSLDSLARLLRFPPGLHVVGSHGLEVHGAEPIELSADEQLVLDKLTVLGARAVEQCGAGAWLEHKPASVVVHTREAHGAATGPVLSELADAVRSVDGAAVKHGHHVIELMAREGNKGEALTALARRIRATSIVYLGDDITDEEAFAHMGPADVPVRVGPGPTTARYRISGPEAAAGYVLGLEAATS